MSTTEQRFGLTISKAENFSDWYAQVVIKSELIDHHDIKGCVILRPEGFYIWKCVKDFFTAEIEKMGVSEAYFPMLVSKQSIEKEKDHIENFAPELAWITKCGERDITPVAVRPTSESIIYPAYKKWLKSHRDLPMKINQWCNVLRWEVRQTTLFIRGREFLWQEGHTCHLTSEEAQKEVWEILELYRRVYEDLLAVPVIKGKKSKLETFGGADFTTTVEAYIPEAGRAVQAATSHFLGQNFSKMFDVRVTDKQEQEVYVYQNSWGITTRCIGIAAMTHSDDKGFVAPPRVASIQVIIVPCGIKSVAESNNVVMNYIEKIQEELRNANIRVKVDDSPSQPGYKFNHWELRGIPIRLEVGPRDVKNKKLVVYRRYNGEKTIESRESIGKRIISILDEIHTDMFLIAKKRINAYTSLPTTFNELSETLDKKMTVKIPWCQKEECEEEIKFKTTKTDEEGNTVVMGAKSMCIPVDEENFPEIPDNKICINCGSKAISMAYFGRSY